MNLFLIRHAQSQANLDPYILQTISNQQVELTSVGVQQAIQTADFLSKYSTFKAKNATIWTSPYLRTKLTAQTIFNVLKQKNVFDNINYKENLYLSERQLGMLEFSKNYKEKYADEVRFYNMNKNFKDDFYVKPVLGESGFDLCLRLDIFLKNEIQKNKHNVNIVITHAHNIKAMNIMYRNISYDNFYDENPFNSSITELTENEFNTLFIPTPRTK